MKPVLLVGLGGDIGVYAFQRAAHERFGWDMLTLSKVVTTFIKHSRLARLEVLPEIHQPSVLVARLNAIAAAHPDHDLLLFTNLDWHVRAIAQHRHELDSRWLVPFCDLATFDRVSSKVAFAQACAEVGVRTPRTIAARFTGRDATSADDVIAQLAAQGVQYPVIGKPALSADWFATSFPGKQKIHHLTDEAQVREVLENLQAVSYPSEFLIQEFVPGDETHMRSLTAYRDRSGTVTLVAGGQVLLEEHTPGTLGIPAAILTGADTEAFADATRFLDHVDYYGFANFDYKVSSRDGDRVFFEVNPRIGRNNFYVTASGANVADVVARDLLPNHIDAAAPAPTPTREVLYSVVPAWLLRRYLPDPALRATVTQARRRHGIAHPLKYRADAGLKRRLYVAALDARLVSKFLQHYPRPTETGF